MRSRAFLLLLFLLSCSEVFAEQSLPFQFRDGLIWVKARTGDRELNFLLDSGAACSVLSLQAARELGVRLGASQQVQLVQGAETGYWASGFAATLAGVRLEGDLLALDLSKPGRACSRPIDGLLGQDFFRDRIVRIDFKRGRISLLEKSDPAPCRFALPLRLHNGAMCVPVGVDDSKPQWVRLDTGCNDGLHWVASRSAVTESAAASIGLAAMQGIYFRTSVQLGSERIPNVKTALHGTEIFSGEAGLLGNAVLSKYRVTIDAIHRRLLLE